MQYGKRVSTSIGVCGDWAKGKSVLSTRSPSEHNRRRDGLFWKLDGDAARRTEWVYARGNAVQAGLGRDASNACVSARGWQASIQIVRRARPGHRSGK